MDWANAAAALFDGGWRENDKEELMKEYGLMESEAEEICKLLKKFAHKEEKENE